MAQNSIFVKLSNYAVLEYIYSTHEKTLAEVTFQKIKNTITGHTLFVNDNVGATFTKNDLDHSFIEIGNGLRIGHLDQDQPFSLDELDDNIDLTKNLNIPTTFNLKYDTIKIHLLSGFHIGNSIDGFGVKLSAEENSGTKSYFLSHIHTAEDQTVTQNPEPFSLGNQVFNRYIELKIPSLSYLNEQFYNLSTYTDKQLATYLSSEEKGFKKESPLFVEFFQFTNFEEIDDKLTYKYNKISDASVPQVDQNSLIAAHLKESDEGDYFEYFAKYDGEFIADYISNLNSLGQSYIILNELKVYENYADLTRQKVQEVNTIQNTNFDKPNLFRPVISDDAYSFIIEYTMRLINQTEDTQVLKTSSITGNTAAARKYGRNIGKIDVKDSSAPIKIYNRRGTSPYNLSINKDKEPNTTITIKNEVIRMVDSYNLAITTENSIVDIEESVENGILKDSNFIYGNGKGAIYLSKFDNYIKIKFFNRNSKDNNEPLPLDTFVLKSENDETENIALVFYGSNNNKKYIYAQKKSIQGNEVTFHIPAHDSAKITDYTNRAFNIIYINSLNEEISLYEGKWSNTVNEFHQIKEQEVETETQRRINEMNELYLNLQRRLDDILSNLRNNTADSVVNNRRQNSNANTTPTETTIASTNPSDNSKKNTKKTGGTKTKRIEKKIKDKQQDDNKQTEETNNRNKWKILEDAAISNDYSVKHEIENVITTGKKLLLTDSKINGVRAGSELDTSIKSNPKQINLTEIPGNETNFDFSSNVNKVKPEFLKDKNISNK